MRFLSHEANASCASPNFRCPKTTSISNCSRETQLDKLQHKIEWCLPHSKSTSRYNGKVAHAGESHGSSLERNCLARALNIPLSNIFFSHRRTSCRILRVVSAVLNSPIDNIFLVR
jgi:hypothetical protein